MKRSPKTDPAEMLRQVHRLFLRAMERAGRFDPTGVLECAEELERVYDLNGYTEMAKDVAKRIR